MRKEYYIHNIVILFVLIIILFVLGNGTGCINNNTDKPLPEDNNIIIPLNKTTEIPEILGNKTNTSIEISKTYTIGTSVNGIPLTVVEIGSGKKIGLVIAGALHGNETNTKALVRGLEEKYLNNSGLVPAHIRMYFLAEINPDGIKNKTRKNGNNVDLNRNFPTEDWKSDAVSPSRILYGSGGTSPGSEPEVQALIGWLLNSVKESVERLYVISFHSAYPPTGSVQPGYMVYGEPESLSKGLAVFIAGVSGYTYLKTWVTKLEITGEFIHWCVKNNISSCDIELPNYNAPSTIPEGKNETTIALFERVFSELLHNFLIDF